jgi:hypothetical protein
VVHNWCGVAGLHGSPDHRLGICKWGVIQFQ